MLVFLGECLVIPREAGLHDDYADASHERTYRYVPVDRGRERERCRRLEGGGHGSKNRVAMSDASPPIHNGVA
jgi:hypothetical protein